MRFIDNLARARDLYNGDFNAHVGDIAILKIDSIGLRIRPALRAQLLGVRGYLPHIDVPALAKLPEGSFGAAFAHFMQSQGLSPFRLSSAIDDDMRARNAFGIRWSTTHDMLHTLTGFDASYPGEIGVLAFTVGQGWTWFLWIQLVAAALFYPFMTGFRLGALWRAARQGYAMGRAARFVLSERMEERFDEPISTLRADLGIVGAPAMVVGR